MKVKKFWPLKQNWATRLLALLLAVLIVALLFLMVDRQVGNPLGCWYTERKIQAHYNAYHPGGRYVVGPAAFSYIDGQMRYVCHLYRQGSIDTGFLAYFTKGAVLSTEKVETLSGNNTYNRFRLRLNEGVGELRARAQEGEFPVTSLYADFYPGERQMVFDAEDPVFRPDMEYDPENLPLPSVLCAEFQPTQEGGHEGDERTAARLRYLKGLAKAQGLAFDYYSVQWFDGSTFWTALDVPADLIQPPPSGDGEDTLTEYLAGMPASKKVNYYPQNTLVLQKSRLLYSGGPAFLPCTEHALS